MSDWRLVENPAYAGKTPTPMTATCHDGTPFLTVQCACGEPMHLHESQIEPLPPEAEIATHCKGCGVLLSFPPGHFQAAFAQLRAEGWLEANPSEG
jgi:hypothetical protein